MLLTGLAVKAHVPPLAGRLPAMETEASGPRSIQTNTDNVTSFNSHINTVLINWFKLVYFRFVSSCLIP